MADLIVIKGTFRVYFNRHAAAPLVCCIAGDDGWELAVAEVIVTSPLHTVYRPKATPDDEDGKPSFWLLTSGTLTVDGTLARIDP